MKTVLKRIMFVLACAVLGGLLWRYRGERGWGSSWGLLMVGAVMSLFIYHEFSQVKRFNVFACVVNGLALMYFVPGWGTVNSQISGYLCDQFASFPNAAVTAEVSRASAVAMAAFVGLGLSALFAYSFSFFLCRKPQKLKLFLIGAAVVIGVRLICEATVSHLILSAIQPQAGQVLEQAAQAQGMSGSAYELYMSHFFDRSWFSDIDHRNYYTCIENISGALAGVAGIIYLSAAVRDRFAALSAAVIELAFGISFAIGTTYHYFGNGGYHFAGVEGVPADFAHYSWSLWELSCGATAFLIIGLFLALSYRKITATAENAGPLDVITSSKAKNAVGYVLVIGFMLSVNIFRPVGWRLNKYSSVMEYCVYAAAVAVTVAFIVLMAKGKIPRLFELQNRTALRTCFLLIFVPNTLTYWFVGQYNGGTDVRANIFQFADDTALFGHVSSFSALLAAATLFMTVYILIYMTPKRGKINE